MQVNYVREHERFIEYAADERLPANAQLLWYALMHIFNQRAEGSEWPDGFIRITNDRLFTYLPIKWDAMAKARNALKQAGLIEFRSGNRNKTAPEYRIIPFYPSCYPFKTDNTGGNMGCNSGGNTGCNIGGNPGDINININETYTKPKQSVDDDDDDDDDTARARVEADGTVRNVFTAAVGRAPHPEELRRLCTAGQMQGFSPGMIAEAVRIAAGRGAASPADYAIVVLNDWARGEVYTPEQAEEYQAEYLRENGKGGLYGSGDPAQDYREREAARERRRLENQAAGIA